MEKEKNNEINKLKTIISDREDLIKKLKKRIQELNGSYADLEN